MDSLHIIARLRSGFAQRDGIDFVIWIALLCVVGTAIFSTALVQLAMGVLAALWLYTLVKNSWKGFRTTVLDLPMVAFIIGRTLSVPFSTHPATSIPALHIEFIFYAAFFLFTNTIRIDRENELGILIRMFVITAVIGAVIGVCMYAFGFSPRATSSTAGTYTLGAYLVVILPLTLLLANTKTFFKTAQYAYMAAAFLVIGVIFTFDRLHWIAAATTFVVAAIINKDARPLIGFLFFAGVAIFVLPQVAERFQLTMTLFTHMSYRDVLWRGATMLGFEHPVIGFGPRTFREIFPLMSELGDKKMGGWHNDFLQVYMESGIVGLLPLLWLIARTFNSSMRALRSHALPEEHRQVLIPLLLCLMLFVAAGGMLDTILGLVFRFDLAIVALIVTAYDKATTSAST